MLSEKNFYQSSDGVYIIGKKTEKTVTFLPVKSEPIGSGDVSSAFLYDTKHKATREIDESREPIRFKLKNNFSARGLASFYENKKGRIIEMCELDSDIITIERNYG